MRALLLLAAFSAIAACSSEEEGDALLNDALARAAREAKPLLIDFYGPHCPPCARMKKETWPAPSVKRELGHYVFLEVDTQEYPSLAARYGVNVIPTLVFLAPDGREIERRMGFRDAAGMTELLRTNRGGG